MGAQTRPRPARAAAVTAAAMTAPAKAPAPAQPPNGLPFVMLDLDAIDASGTTVYKGVRRPLSPLTAHALNAFRRLRGVDPTSPEYEADERIVLDCVFRGWPPEVVEQMDYAPQAYAVHCAWQATEFALARAIAATFGTGEDDEGNGDGAGDAAPSTTSTRST
jgi:hypothetical protein